MKHRSTMSSLITALILGCFTVVSFGQLPTFAEHALAIGRISGIVWRDSNNNGVREPQELPLVGYPVYLQRVGEEVVGTMVAVVYSDDEGVFIFDTIEEGQYQIFPEEGHFALVDVIGVNATATVDLPVPVHSHQIFLPMTVR